MILEAIRGDTPRRSPKARVCRSRSLTSLSKLAEDQSSLIHVGDMFADVNMDDIFGPGSKVMVVDNSNATSRFNDFSKLDAFASFTLDAMMPEKKAESNDQFDCFGCPIYDLQAGTETDTSVSQRGQSHQKVPQRISQDMKQLPPSQADTRKQNRKPRRRRQTTPADPSPGRRRQSPRIRRRRSMGDIWAAVDEQAVSSRLDTPPKTKNTQQGAKRNKPRRRKSLGNGSSQVKRNISGGSGEGKSRRRTSSVESKRSPNATNDSPRSSSPSRPKLQDKNPSTRSVASRHSRGSNHSSKSHKQRRSSLKVAEPSSPQRRQSTGEGDLDRMILEYQAAARQELEQSFSQYVSIPPLLVAPTGGSSPAPGSNGRRRSHSNQRRRAIQGRPMDRSSSQQKNRQERRRSRRSNDFGPNRGKSPSTSRKQLTQHAPSMPELRPL